MVADAQQRRLSVIDAATLRVLQEIELALPLCSAPKIAPDGRFAFYCTIDGELCKYDLQRLAMAAPLRVPAEVRDMALSGDGRWVLLGNASPRNVLLFDSALNLVRTYPATSLDGAVSSPVASVHDAAPRRCFIVAFEMLPQLWEISYDPAAEPIFDGLVHDYRMAEAIATRGFLGVRRTPLDQPMSVAGFDLSHRHVLGTARAAQGAPASLDIVNLDVRRRIAQLPLRVAPLPRQAASFMRRNEAMIAVADASDPGAVRFIAPDGWRVARTLRADAAVLSIRSHPQVRDLWMLSRHAADDHVALTLIDKDTLQARTVLALAGNGPARLSFSCDGARAFVSRAGMLSVLDAQTGAELKPPAPLSFGTSTRRTG